MTPAIVYAKKSAIEFQVHSYPASAAMEGSGWGLEAAQKLGVDAQKVFKTLVVELDSGDYATAVVPVSHKLNLKSCARSLGAKKAQMAPADVVQRITGYVLGGVSPLGQKKRLAMRLDESAQQHPRIMVSAGKRGLEIELAPQDLLTLCKGRYAVLTQET